MSQLPVTGRLRGRALALALALALVVAAPSARADDGRRLPPRSYLWDGGAVPFLYLPLALTLGLRATRAPRATPLGFSPDEGGERYDGGQYPTPMLYVDAALAGGLIVAGGADDARWYHLKGLGQGLATTALLTTIAKDTFGRHRPSYDLTPGVSNPDDLRRSFWSGHASSTLATATYLGLYARQHVFARWRRPGTLPWWEGLAYLGLASAAVAVPVSQVRLHRHHASDVITGGLVGAGTATLFYLYQERRYRRAGRGGPVLTVVPAPSIEGVALVGTW